MIPLPTPVVPRFDITLPLSGKKISARPFLVGEQKVILQAKEMGDKLQLNNAIDDVLKLCTFDKVDLDSLDVADIEYLVLQLRSKSIDEIVKMSFQCKHMVEGEHGLEYCDHNIPCLVPIVDVTAQPDTREKTIMISESIGVVMQNLKYGDYKKAVEKDAEGSSEMILLASIESIFDEDSIYKREDYSDEDLQVFLNNIYSSDFAKIDDYVATIPALEWSTTLKCKKCGTEEKVSFKGLDDFLV